MLPDHPVPGGPDVSRALSEQPLYLGVDVQINRGVPLVVMGPDGVVRQAVWHGHREAPAALAELISGLGATRCQVGIDAPRRPLPRRRRWSFRRGSWRRDAGRLGRHCEVAVRALGLGSPQWTPLRADAPAWMRLGFALFAAATRAGATAHEVFPSVSYRQLDGVGEAPPVTLPLSAMAAGPKDLLDAVAAAYTVWRWDAGEGAELGGGDGLGTIVVPRAVADHPVLVWPDENGPAA
jgi:hypothetical protein